ALARQALAAGVHRFVYLSSLLARLPSPDREPEDPYAATKREAEAALGAIAGGSAMQLAILRPPLIYGAGAGANFARLVRAIERGRPLPFGAIENRRSFLWIDNLADLVVLLLRQPLPIEGLHEPQDPEPLSTPAFCRAIGEALGRPARLPAVPVALLRRAGRLAGRGRALESLTGNLVADDRSLREGLGWVAPVETPEALRRSLGRPAPSPVQGPLWLEALYGGLGVGLALIRPGLRAYLARR
ncbi:MAG: NAD-dependent epimerase/dehydratase family protein, partial [Tistlia sp.]